MADEGRMAGIKLNAPNVEVLIRRFMSQPLTGNDLAEIRIFCGETQEGLRKRWGFSRNTIARMESAGPASLRDTSLYLGLMFMSLSQQVCAQELLVLMRKARKAESAS